MNGDAAEAPDVPEVLLADGVRSCRALPVSADQKASAFDRRVRTASPWITGRLIVVSAPGSPVPVAGVAVAFVSRPTVEMRTEPVAPGARSTFTSGAVSR